MDIMQIGAQLLSSKLGANMDQGMVQTALKSLLGSSNSGGGIDLMGLVGKLQGGDLKDIASSWLGSGENKEISPSQVENVIGSDKINQAASQLGVEAPTLLSGLQSMLPQLVDKASPSGSILDSVGGLGGALNMAKNILK